MTTNIQRTLETTLKMAQDIKRHFIQKNILMANKHTKRCSTLHVNREMTLHPLEWLTRPNADKSVEQQDLSYLAGRDAKW